MSVDDGEITLSPFLSTLCESDTVVLMPQYTWQMDAAQFQCAPGVRCILSEEEFVHEEAVKFRFVLMRNASSSKYAALGLVITSLPPSVRSVSGAFSIMVSELDWCLNRFHFNNLPEDVFGGTHAFEDRLLHDVSSLSIKVAMCFDWN